MVLVFSLKELELCSTRGKQGEFLLGFIRLISGLLLPIEAGECMNILHETFLLGIGV